ncbi:T9SS type A sorting domain-containing protein [Maribacter sp. 2-571]|uniref:T9SS type A sorting domain-containing protein n=1 Tax=Maribacter sp. 2-571 TaxID=3417569 RepID=UPI003D34F633
MPTTRERIKSRTRCGMRKMLPITILAMGLLYMNQTTAQQAQNTSFEGCETPQLQIGVRDAVIIDSPTLTIIAMSEESGAKADFSSKDAPKVIVYPNPVRNELTVATSSENPVKRTVFQGLDQKTFGVRIARKTENTVTYSVAHLPTGTYIVRIFFRNGTSLTKKIIKL